MKNGRKSFLMQPPVFLFLLLLLFACFFPSGGRAEEILYFYENYCSSCHPEKEFRQDYREWTGRELTEEAYSYYNVLEPEGRKRYEEVRREYALEKDSFPLLIVDGKIFQGSYSIEAGLPAYAVETSGETQSVLYYLYIAACESCGEVKNLLDALPETITVSRGKYSFASGITVIPVNIGLEMELAQALFDAYQIPEDRRTAPMILAGDRVYRGVKEIRLFLTAQFERGLAIGTKIVTLEKTEPSEKPESDRGWTAVGTALAGLIGGLNPCALSMMLLFLAVILKMERRVFLFASVYLGVKYAVYLCIGLLFFELFQRWDPSWLIPAAKYVMTALALGLAALQIHDAFRARQARYGKMLSQLPGGMRTRLSRRIQQLREKPERLLPAVAAVAATVAAGEFLCAGQVYLLTLLNGLRQEELTGGVWLLAVYCLAFCFPSALLTLLAEKGKNSRLLAAKLQEGLPAIKWLTALFMLGLVALAWLV